MVRTVDDVVSIERRAAAEATSATGDRVHVVLAATVDAGVVPGGRPLPATSACGLCGRLSVDTLDQRRGPRGDARFSAELLASLPGRLRSGQAVFAETGGLHAAALFTAEGELVALREDVGRHNAVDKVIGWAFLEGLLPLSAHILMVSGRSSFEIAQKALAAGIPILCAVSAPSSLAVDLAQRFGMTLVGFLRGERFNVYSGAGRVETGRREDGETERRKGGKAIGNGQ